MSSGSWVARIRSVTSTAAVRTAATSIPSTCVARTPSASARAVIDPPPVTTSIGVYSP